MNDGPRDEIDGALANSMSAIAPEVADTEETLAALRPRLRRARARRRLAQGSLVAAALVVLLSAVALGAANGSKGHVHVEAPSSVPGSTAARTSTTREPTSTTTPTTRATARQPTVTSPSKNAPGLPLPIAPPATNPDRGSFPQGARGSRSTPSPPSAPGTTAPTSAGQIHTYGSAGGNLTVRADNGRLSLVSFTPALGYTPQVRTNQPDDIEVRFDSRTEEWVIRVRVENGAPAAEITQHSQWPEEITWPPNQPRR